MCARGIVRGCKTLRANTVRPYRLCKKQNNLCKKKSLCTGYFLLFYGKFFRFLSFKKGTKPPSGFGQVDVVGETLDVDGGQLGLDERQGVGEELVGHGGVVGVDPLERDLLFQVGDLADGM